MERENVVLHLSRCLGNEKGKKECKSRHKKEIRASELLEMMIECIGFEREAIALRINAF